MVKLSNDLLENFATWPKHVQDSFLEIVSHQVTRDEETQRLANLTELDKRCDEFQAVLPVMSKRTTEFIEQLTKSPYAAKFLENFETKAELVERIAALRRELEELASILQVRP